METKNIYDNLFTMYHKNENKNYSISQDEFENQIELIVSDDYELYTDITKKLDNLMYEIAKKYYTAGIKTALELLKY